MSVVHSRRSLDGDCSSKNRQSVDKMSQQAGQHPATSYQRKVKDCVECCPACCCAFGLTTSNGETATFERNTSNRIKVTPLFGLKPVTTLR